MCSGCAQRYRQNRNKNMIPPPTAPVITKVEPLPEPVVAPPQPAPTPTGNGPGFPEESFIKKDS